MASPRGAVPRVAAVAASDVSTPVSWFTVYDEMLVPVQLLTYTYLPSGVTRTSPGPVPVATELICVSWPVAPTEYCTRVLPE